MQLIADRLTYLLCGIFLFFMSAHADGQTSFATVLHAKYDTLIPIFDAYYLTYARMDSAQVRDGKQFVNSEVMSPFTETDVYKWGVIDTNGSVVLPFIFDGIKAISKNTGVASVYFSSWSLNTGVPRYVYSGKYIIFSKEGHMVKKLKPFSKTIVGIADNHFSSYVIRNGPYFYLPNAFNTNKIR